MNSAESIFEIDGPIATLTFNRPEARNALTWEMYEALYDACDRVDEEAAARVFVLRGAGGAFAAGTDIGQFTKFQGSEDGLKYEARIDAVLHRLACVTVPTVARVEGVAAGGAFVIAMTCDLRVCSPKSSFGAPIARTLGNCLSAASLTRLLKIAHPSVLKDLLFTGRMMPAEEAYSLGMVTRLLPEDELDAGTRDLCLTIAANAPLTIRSSKEILHRLDERARPAREIDADQIRLCYGSEDFREGVEAFLAKRSPHWIGR